MEAESGTLEEFLFERYCLYTVHKGKLCIAPTQHGTTSQERLTPRSVQGAQKISNTSAANSVITRQQQQKFTSYPRGHALRGGSNESIFGRSPDWMKASTSSSPPRSIGVG